VGDGVLMGWEGMRMDERDKESPDAVGDGAVRVSY